MHRYDANHVTNTATTIVPSHDVSGKTGRGHCCMNDSTGGRVKTPVAKSMFRLKYETALDREQVMIDVIRFACNGGTRRCNSDSKDGAWRLGNRHI
jgi:hypothetical protein